jgi:hypothetical protein
MKFPLSVEAFELAPNAFRAVSQNKVINGCVGALDGWI